MRKIFGYWAVAPAAIALLGFLTVQSIDTGDEFVHRFAELESKLKHSDTTLILDVVKLRGGLLSNYDSIGEMNKQIWLALARLRRQADALDDEVKEGFIRLQTELESAQSRREPMLEQFLAKFSVLKNSLRNFPLLASDVIESATASHHENLAVFPRRLLNNVLVFSLHGEQVTRTRLMEQIGRLEANSRDQPPESRAELNLLISHARMITDYTSVVDQLFEQVLAIGFDDRIEAVVSF